MKRKLKIIIGPVVLIATTAAFIWYISNNPSILDQLGKTSVATVVIIVLLYALIFVTLLGIMYASLLLYGRYIKSQENVLLNAYASLANFFGPGQSGPAVRAAYLKIKHSILVKQYVFATLVYYAFFAILSGGILVGAALPWWQAMGMILLILVGCYGIVRWYIGRHRQVIGIVSSGKALVKPFVIMGVFTTLQVVFLVGVYATELRSIDSSISLSQVLIYTGAANFSLFVSLTPGAIGFREAFLVFSQNLHHISNDIIVAANVLDRAVYLIFLGVLFVIVLTMHAGKKLKIAELKASAKAEQAEQQ